MRPMIDARRPARAWQHAGETGPPVDLYETNEAVIIRLAVPGADGASLSLTIEDDHVRLRGESTPPGARWGDRTLVHWQEIPYGRFERTVPLPTPVRKDAAKATYKNGVLEIALPKRQTQAARTVQIAIT
jgi:HSP20 family protein